MIQNQTNQQTQENPFSMNYTFNEREVKTLARLCRDYQAQIPPCLEDFARCLEKKIYENMSIDEVEKFYL